MKPIVQLPEKVFRWLALQSRKADAQYQECVLTRGATQDCGQYWTQTRRVPVRVVFVSTTCCSSLARAYKQPDRVISTSSRHFLLFASSLFLRFFFLYLHLRAAPCLLYTTLTLLELKLKTKSVYLLRRLFTKPFLTNCSTAFEKR